MTVNFINKSQDLADFLISDEFGATARQKLLYSKPIQLLESAKDQGPEAIYEMLELIEDYSECLEHLPRSDRVLVYQIFIQLSKIELTSDSQKKN